MAESAIYEKKKAISELPCFLIYGDSVLSESNGIFQYRLPKIIKEPSALSNQSEKGTLGRKILLAYFKMLGKVIDPESKQGNLTLRGSGIGFRLTE